MPKDKYESIPKLSDLKPESIRVSIDDVLNKELVITDARFMQSSQFGTGSYVIIEAERISGTGKQSISFTTSSNVIMDQAGKLKDKMPFRATVKKLHGYYKLY